MGHSEKSVVVGISGQTLTIRKNVKVEKDWTFEHKSVLVGIFGQTLMIRQNVKIERRWDIRKSRWYLEFPAKH